MQSSELDAEFYQSLCADDKPASIIPAPKLVGMLTTRKRILSKLNDPPKIGQLSKDAFDISLLPETDAMFYLDDSGIIDKCISVLQKIDIHNKKQTLYEQIIKVSNHAEIIEILNYCHMVSSVLEKYRFQKHKIRSYDVKLVLIIFYLFTKSKNKAIFYNNVSTINSIQDTIHIISSIPYSRRRILDEFVTSRRKDPRHNISMEQMALSLKCTFNLFDYVFGIGSEQKRRHRL